MCNGTRLFLPILAGIHLSLGSPAAPIAQDVHDLGTISTFPSDDIDPAIMMDQSPFIRAIEHCDRDKVSRLIAAGANVRERDKFDRTPLHDAHCRDVAVMLLDAGADPNAKSRMGITPLHLASRDVALVLISHGADVRACDNHGRTALHSAAADDRTGTMELLLDKGLGVDARSDDGDTPLHRAAKRGKISAAKLLLKRGANPNAQDSVFYTPLFMASNKEMVELLIAHGANPNKVGLFGDMALHLAARHASAEVVESLARRTECLGCKNNYGKTPIDEAIARGEKKVVRALKNVISTRPSAEH
jgi:ankyrin repeat protein